MATKRTEANQVSAAEWVQHMCHLLTVEYYTDFKKEKLPLKTAEMELKGSVLSDY
jgi:hypothetical protein